MDYVASSVMRKELQTVTPSMSVAELEACLVEHQVSGFPVVEHGKLVGVASRSDIIRTLSPDWDITHLPLAGEDSGPLERLVGPRLVKSLGDRLRNLRVRDIMTPEVVTVEPNDYLHDVAARMYRHRIHRVFVVQDEELLGIITPFDFVRLYAEDQIGPDIHPGATRDF